MGMFALGESQEQRITLAVPPLAAVSNATSDKDYMEIFRAPSDQHVLVERVRFSPNRTQAAAATNYVDLQMVAISGTTVRTLGSVITTNTGGGWTAQTEIDMVLPRNNVKLRANERLALQIDNVGTGVATAGFAVHAKLKVGA